MSEAERDLICRSYRAFNARDLDAALEGMHPDVDWPNVIDGGRLRGVDAIREYWNAQFESVDPKVWPERFSEDARGQLIVDVHQLVRERETGEVIADECTQHAYELRGGLIGRMEIRTRASGG